MAAGRKIGKQTDLGYTLKLEREQSTSYLLATKGHFTEEQNSSNHKSDSLLLFQEDRSKNEVE